MAANIDRFKKDLGDLVRRGSILECTMVRDTLGKDALRKALGDLSDEAFEDFLKLLLPFKTEYEKWYSESLSLLRGILPDRVQDFKNLYEIPKGRKSADYANYVIEDYLINLRVTHGGSVKVKPEAAIPKLQRQTAILSAAEARFESSLFEIRQLVQADLFDSEIESARELLKNQFLRAAGAIAGVVLEKHLRQVCDDHSVSIGKKNPGIGDLNEALKNASVIDIPQWRHVTLMGDYRNLCDHNKQKEPTGEQVSDLIDGTDKILKTIA